MFFRSTPIDVSVSEPSTRLPMTPGIVPSSG
jgi:hypothetical protein